MRKVVSKILIVFLLISYVSEITVSAFAHIPPVCTIADGDDSEDKKEEEKKEKEENKEKISSFSFPIMLAIISENTLLRNHFFKNSTFLSLPEIPPDQA
jgi:hypothetical protein